MTQAAPDIRMERRFDEFSPKRLLLLINKAFKYLLSKWWIIILAGLALGSLYAALNFSKKPAYTAELVFALDDGAVKSSSNNFSALSEELGFGSTYEAGGVFSSMTNILELLQSRLIIEKTLKRSVDLNGKKILFADFFLDSLNFRNKWMNSSSFKQINFLNTKASKEEELFRNRIINNIYNLITSPRFTKIDRKGKGTTLIQVTFTSENESFSKYFLEALIDEVSKFYIEIKTQRAKLQLDFIQRRTDSIRNAFGGAIYGRAAFSDANINPVRQIAIAPVERKQTDVQILRETYINLVKSLESSKTSLMQDTPLFQYLDTPVFPLKVTTNSLLKKFIFFFIIGAFLAGIILLVVRFFRFILQSE
jgi:uncharacterized protein involved in exopolysaccharide biosynthesis